ncbi:MAG: rRNA cytosine-C5-methyltransferase [Paludibacter sp.]|nr:rRNA cytosine-C5-methyltransferase [Paludibacter sp.]
MNLPDKFVESVSLLLKDELEPFLDAVSQPAMVSIRVNNKTELHPSEDKVAWCDKGYYLNERPLFTADPLFHAGAYYVQEASSMFLCQVVKQYLEKAETVLDLCAAPGGKSTLLLQTLSEDCLLVSNEIIRNRAYILAENIVKWGNPNVLVTNNKAADFGGIRNFFDAIVVDAPCSGEGMFRKDVGAVDEWSPENVEMCAFRQIDIISDVWNALKPGGILVYSTCTYNRKENEDNVEKICSELGGEFLKVDFQPESGILETNFGYRFFPHRTKGEGFFLSVVRKSDKDSTIKQDKLPEQKKGIKFVKSIELPFMLDPSKKWIFVNDANFIRAYDESKFDKFIFLIKQLKCIESSLLVAELKGKDLVPSAQLALSKSFRPNPEICVELDKQQAIAFLKKEAIYLPDSPRGYLLVTYRNVALGWVKNLGNRSNNLYPNNWRIRMNIEKGEQTWS